LYNSNREIQRNTTLWFARKTKALKGYAECRCTMLTYSLVMWSPDAKDIQARLTDQMNYQRHAK
jgi:hypothetical protein